MRVRQVLHTAHLVRDHVDLIIRQIVTDRLVLLSVVILISFAAHWGVPLPTRLPSAAVALLLSFLASGGIELYI